MSLRRSTHHWMRHLRFTWGLAFDSTLSVRQRLRGAWEHLTQATPAHTLLAYRQRHSGQPVACELISGQLQWLKYERGKFVPCAPPLFTREE
jgi:hypothetical protein